MLTVYILIALSPLAACAMHSPHVAHAVTKQCSGDCSICGCSPESRAAKTCCCARKHAQEESLRHIEDDSDEPECCRKARGEDTKKQETIIACGCPCSNGKPEALSGSSLSEIIPFIFTCLTSRQEGELRYFHNSGLPVSRYVVPPDPPPEVSFS